MWEGSPPPPPRCITIDDSPTLTPRVNSGRHLQATSLHRQVTSAPLPPSTAAIAPHRRLRTHPPSPQLWTQQLKVGKAPPAARIHPLAEQLWGPRTTSELCLCFKHSPPCPGGESGWRGLLTHPGRPPFTVFPHSAPPLHAARPIHCGCLSSPWEMAPLPTLRLVSGLQPRAGASEGWRAWGQHWRQCARGTLCPRQTLQSQEDGKKG